MIKGLPAKLQTLRSQYGYSQKQVAAKLGVSPSIVSGYETGERTPSVEMLLALSYLYSCSTDYLLARQNAAPDTALSLHGLTDRQISALTALVDTLRK